MNQSQLSSLKASIEIIEKQLSVAKAIIAQIEQNQEVPQEVIAESLSKSQERRSKFTKEEKLQKRIRAKLRIQELFGKDAK
jgi:hypothetical protein